MATEILTLGEALGDDVARLQGHRLIGLTQFYHGNHESAAHHSQSALTLYDHERHQDLRFRFSHDPRAAALTTLSLSRCATGLVDEAKSIIDHAIDSTRDHPSTLGWW